jgi:hypothetical protein
MPFEKKPTRIVGRGDWAVEVPRPPKWATHARMTLFNDFDHKGNPKIATLPLDDFGCFKGVAGEFQYIRMNNTMKILEEYDGTWGWNGRSVIGIENLV